MKRGKMFGDSTERALRRMLSHDRLAMFRKAADYINYELIPGDILEFGVFTGRTLAALTWAHLHSQYSVDFPRAMRGFDSFKGLPPASDPHPRWEQDNCTVNHLQSTPSLKSGSVVTAKSVQDLFVKLKLPGPEIHEGPFGITVPLVVPATCSAAALVHIDCDIYESAHEVLFGIEPALQDGTVLLFDDWFHYRGSPVRGVQRAFSEFFAAFPHWMAVDYGPYAIFCKAFILSRTG